jgi:hypothetical protein
MRWVRDPDDIRWTAILLIGGPALAIISFINR